MNFLKIKGNYYKNREYIKKGSYFSFIEVEREYMKRNTIIITAAIILFLNGGFLHNRVHAMAGEERVKSTELQTPFQDISSSFWAATPILTLKEKGYMDGYQDGTFKPNQYATRAEAASVIARSLEIPLETDFELNAKDLSPSHQYYQEICKLAELGIVQNSEHFRPEEPLRRAQIAKMLALSYGVQVDHVNKTSFKDYKKDYWARDYIESLADVGIIEGTTPTTFSPNQYVTRAQLAVLVYRGIEFQNKIKSYQLAYDYLSKHYISTVNSAVNWTNEVIDLVNEERKKVGVPPLKQDLALTQLAIIKAQDMIQRKYFDHFSPYYGHPWDMATLFDYEFTRFGENIARNFDQPKDVVNAWMASEKHRENMLKENYTNIGVGIKSDSQGNYYWVQLFSSK